MKSGTADGPGRGETASSSGRLAALDFLRGLVLSMVLVDHVDDVLVEQELFNRWTLKGLGFSDAAEAFVLLAGFTFGWVFTPRLQRSGFWSVQRRATWRAMVLYGSMLLTTVVVAGLAASVSRTSLAFRLPLTVTTSTMFAEAINDTATFRDPVWGVAILVVYVCVLPALPGLLVLARSSPGSAIAVSVAVYAGSQLVPALDFSDSGFNPLAWQLLAVGGLLAGSWARTGRADRLLHPVAIALAALGLACGLICRHGADVRWVQPIADSCNHFLNGSPAISKTNLGWIRVLHAAAVAVAAAAMLRRWPSIPQASWARPFVWSGRHSLPLFCIGVVLAYLAALASAFLPAHLLTLLFLAADALLIQFALAWLLEQRRVRVVEGVWPVQRHAAGKDG